MSDLPPEPDDDDSSEAEIDTEGMGEPGLEHEDE
jgi:hypothetical protein